MLRSLACPTRRWIMTSAAATISSSKPKLVAIIGATGTGKSQLAVDLALKHNGEIVNCDAVQMYEGLPIITNKISREEQKGVPHHLLGTIKLDEPTWTVSRFVPEALSIIDSIKKRGKLPILVGGTHYYVQSLLIRDTTVDEDAANGDEEYSEALQQPTEVLLERLREVDPVMAGRWHPNDRRKIQRSLQIWLQTGKRASDIYSEQQQAQDDGEIGSSPAGRKEDKDKLRFDPVVFWLHAAPEVLKPRLDKRVLRMMDAGLLDELQVMDKFKLDQEAEGVELDMSKGIWVSIGYKEFASFLEAQKHGSCDEVSQAKAEGIEKAQTATRQYAKRQIRWIQYKFLNAMHRNGISERMFLLDGSHTSDWNELVTQPAVHVVSYHLAGQALPSPSSISPSAHDLLVPKGQDVSYDREEWVNRSCETCQVVAVSRKEWDKHIESNRHKRASAAAAKRAASLSYSQSLADSRGTDNYNVNEQP